MLNRILAAVTGLLVLAMVVVALAVWRHANTDHGKLDMRVAAFLLLGELTAQEPIPHDQRDPQTAREAGNAVMAGVRGLPAEVAEVTDRLLPVEPEVAVRIYRPKPGRLPALVYYHGGGWTAGSIDTHDNVTRYLAANAGIVVISVDWRRAPEHKYPAGLNDAYNAALWVWQHAEQLDIDAERIAVGGDSSGGNFAAVVAQMARDRGVPHLAHQVLIYPATDVSDLGKPSYQHFGTGFGLSLDSVVWYRSLYLDGPEQYTDPRVSPLFGNLQNLPSTTLLNAQFDVLNSDAELYAEALRAAGVAVEHYTVPGVIHGFINADKLLPERAREGLDFLVQGLQQALELAPKKS